MSQDIDMTKRGGIIAKKQTTIDLAHKTVETVSGGFGTLSTVVGAFVIIVCACIGVIYFFGNFSASVNSPNSRPISNTEMPWQ